MMKIKEKYLTTSEIYVLSAETLHLVYQGIFPAFFFFIKLPISKKYLLFLVCKSYNLGKIRQIVKSVTRIVTNRSFLTIKLISQSNETVKGCRYMASEHVWIS